MAEKLKSRKFWVMLLTGILVVVNDAFGLGLSEQAIGEFVTMAAAYVVGQGINDHGKARAAVDYAATADALKKNEAK